jgi:hypothetical protein
LVRAGGRFGCGTRGFHGLPLEMEFTQLLEQHRVAPVQTGLLQEEVVETLTVVDERVRSDETGARLFRLFRELSVGMRKSEAVTLRHPVMPIADGFGS